MGRFAKLLPSSVLNGILAAIGIIIFAKQIHFALGTMVPKAKWICFAKIMIPIAAKIPFSTEEGSSLANRPIFNNPWIIKNGTIC